MEEFLKYDVINLSNPILGIIIKHHLILYNHTPNAKEIDFKCKHKLKVLFKQYPNICWQRVV